MRRYLALAGIAVIVLAWTALGAVDETGGTWPSIPWYGALLAAAVWYSLCGFNAIDQWVRRPVMLFGKYAYTAGPGLTWVEPIFYSTRPDVPVQDLVVSLRAPNVQTRNNVGLDIDAVLTFRVSADGVERAVVEVADVTGSVVKRAMSIVTDSAGTKSLDDILQHRRAFSQEVVATLQERVNGWGVTIQAIEIRGLKINDPEIEKAIAMKARAEKEAEAELARATMQARIAEELNNAAGKFTPDGWRLKAIEAFLEAVRGQNNTILVPTSIAEGLGHMLPRVDVSQSARTNGAGH